jgi:Zn-dependent peptidase ImmA (M78 family)
MASLSEILAERKSSFTRLSKTTGLDIERLTALSEGAEGSLRELRLVAGALKMKMSELVETVGDPNTTSFLFRRASPHLSEKFFSSVDRMASKISYALEIIGRAEPGLWRGEFEGLGTTFEDAEVGAATFRRLFVGDDQLRPLPDLPILAVDGLGALLFVVRIEDLDGASAIVNGIPFIFLGERFAGRMLFTLAHEIGHLVANISADNFAVLDNCTEKRSVKTRNHGERFANAFASSLLMPRPAVLSAIGRFRQAFGRKDHDFGEVDLLLLARFFDVSFAVAGSRSEQLGLIPQGGTSALAKVLHKQFGGPEKRADQIGLPARTRIKFPTVSHKLLDAAIEKVRKGEVSLGRAAAILELSASDVVLANAQRA